MKYYTAALRAAVLLGSLSGSVSHAAVLWTWEFGGTESGSFQTDGTIAEGVAPPGRYVIDDISFTVTQSSLAENVGARYVEWQEPQGFLWDGTTITQWWRSDGLYTNGVNYFREPDADFLFSFAYRFNTEAAELAYEDRVVGGMPDILVSGPLTLSAIPEPATLCLSAFFGLALCRRRRGR